MKNKILGLAAIIIIAVCIGSMGCASMSGSKSSNFEGIWVRANGTTFTFTKSEYELVDMENGVAAYGTFKLGVKNGLDRIQFTNANVFNLKDSTEIKDAPGGESKVKDFQKTAFEEYHLTHPEQQSKNLEQLAEKGQNGSIISSYGGWPQYYSIDDNSFTLVEYLSPSGPTWYTESYKGQFFKQ